MLSRTRLFKVQYRLYQHLKRYSRRHLGALSPELQKYYKSYQNDFRRYKRVSTKHELMNQIKMSSVVLVGDYHTLPQAQRMLLRLIRELALNAHTHQPWLCDKNTGGPFYRQLHLHFEMFHDRDRTILEKFCRGEIHVDELWRQTNLSRGWPFPKNGYAELLRLAQELGILVHPLSTKQKTKQLLKSRDADAAKFLMQEVVKDPAGLHFVLIGDMHLASKHLPVEIIKTAKRQGISRLPLVVIHQNHEELYWRLVFKRKLDAPNVVEIKPRTFCIFGSPPWVKLQSQIRWAEHVASMHPGAGGMWNAFRDGTYASDLVEDIGLILDHMVSFLGISPCDHSHLTVSGPSEIQLLLELDHQKNITVEEKDFITQLIRGFKGVYLPSIHHLFLRDLSLNPVSALTGVFLYCELSKTKELFSNPKRQFFHFVWREALGFLGSKLVNSRRKCYGLVDYAEALSGNASKNLSSTDQILGWVLHQEDSSKKLFQNLPSENASVPMKVNYMRAAKLLGKTLGEGIFRALINGECSLEEVRILYHTPFLDKQGAELYSHWVRLLDRKKLREFSRYEVL